MATSKPSVCSKMFSLACSSWAFSRNNISYNFVTPCLLSSRMISLTCSRNFSDFVSSCGSLLLRQTCDTLMTCSSFLGCSSTWKTPNLCYFRFQNQLQLRTSPISYLSCQEQSSGRDVVSVEPGEGVEHVEPLHVDNGRVDT